MVTLADTTIAPTHASDAPGSARGSCAGGEWVSHPVATAVLRAAAIVGPLLAAVAVVLACRAVVQVPADILGRVTWGLTVSAAATATLFGVAALLRRALPLAALLRLSLAFPDQAPSRFLIARRTATLHQSQARVAAAFVADDDIDAAGPAAAIRHCLELVASLAHHDRITRGHCERVRAYCDLIGEQLGLSHDDRQRLQWAGLLHDVGKVGVPSHVLNKRGRLTASEWEQIKAHPSIGARLTRTLEPWLGDWVRGVGEHHERWDGDGYPAGLSGTEISLAARIIAVADAFDVMTAARSYKEPLPAESARTELVRCAGTQFDEDVVRAFVAVSIGKLRRAMGPSAALAQIPVVGSLLVTPSLGAAAPLASAAIVIGSLAAPVVLTEDVPRTASTSTKTVERPSPSREDRESGPPIDDRDARSLSPGAPEASGRTPGEAPSEGTPPVVTPPPATGTPTTSTTVPGALDPVIDPVTDEVVDPLVDTVDDLLPGLGLEDAVDDLRCLLPILGCPPDPSVDRGPSRYGAAAMAESKTPSSSERTDWNPVLRGEFAKPYWAQLQQFVVAERARTTVYPPKEDVFAALHLTPFADVKVVILGQDPYHGAGQAHGLCFSVRDGVPAPPSLVNIFKELQADLGIEPPSHGCLDAWARQGVLLLNATLTVRARQAASHQGKGWETFTDEVLRAVNAKPERVVFILWGAAARKKRGLVDTSRHVVIESAHPSPLSASNGFFGSRPFSRANVALEEAGREPVDWHLPG